MINDRVGSPIYSRRHFVDYWLRYFKTLDYKVSGIAIYDNLFVTSIHFKWLFQQKMAAVNDISFVKTLRLLLLRNA